ncbi:MAG: hypothetical protein EXS36_14310 [Pedosphaera sp.]|nr:hypothetical protein [Pedosphaera sp.]
MGIASFPEFLRHHLNSQREYVRQKQLFKTIKRDVTTLDHVFALLDRLEKDAAWFEGLNDYASQFWLDYQGAKEQVRVLNSSPKGMGCIQRVGDFANGPALVKQSCNFINGELRQESLLPAIREMRADRQIKDIFRVSNLSLPSSLSGKLALRFMAMILVHSSGISDAHEPKPRSKGFVPQDPWDGDQRWKFPAPKPKSQTIRLPARPQQGFTRFNNDSPA